jgi:hypothetical protein
MLDRLYIDTNKIIWSEFSLKEVDEMNAVLKKGSGFKGRGITVKLALF